MSELLPILFARGQNESVDPRVSPPNVHLIAKNVRWRKDGRPAKRFGLSNLSAAGLDSGGSTYTQHPVNFVGGWHGAPLLGLGAGVRRLVGSTWSDVTEANQSHLPHFAPGRHDPIARSDLATLGNGTVAYTNGYLLYAWDDGTSIYVQVVSKAGAILFAAKELATGIKPRAVAVGNLIYVVYAASAAVTVATFDTTTLTFTATTSIGTLSLAGMFFDACAQGSNWVLTFQSGTSNITVARLTGATTPAVFGSASISTTASPGFCRIGIVASSGSTVFVAWLEQAFGNIRFQTFNATLGATSSITTVETDTNNVDQPSMVLDSLSAAGLFWGGANGNYSYMRYVDIASSGAAGTTIQVQHVRPCSKPFYGNGDAFALDGRFIWCHTDNPVGWRDQKTFYMLWLNTNNNGPKNVMWTPGMVGSTIGSNQHMSDVVVDGTGAANTTFWTVLNQSVRDDLGGHDCIGIDSVSFTSIFGRQREAARDIATVGRATQISGGALYEFNGSNEETGFMHSPVISTATATIGGNLEFPGDYLYVAVYEWLDSQGRRHRSAPSDPIAMSTTSSNKSGTLVISELTGYARRSPPSIHVYRTLAGGTTYHRVTPAVGAPAAFGSGLTVTYVDSVVSDVNASTQEFIYTDGGVTPNILPPPCTFMCVCASRVWLGGQLERNNISSSKLLVDGEPTQFADPSAFEFDVFLPEECTGLAGLDGTVVAFARESIYLVTGDGPDDQGTGGYNPPQKLPTDVGCIDWRSVVETSLGVFFQSKRGIFLLPRGFNTPLFIGAELDDTLTTYPICVSATLVSIQASNGQLGEVSVRFVMADAEASANTVCCVYDLRTQGWSTDVSPDTVAFGPGGVWTSAGAGDVYVQSKSASGVFASLFYETNISYADHGIFIPTTLGTGDIRPFGLTGFGHFRKVSIVGEYRDSSMVTVAVSVDGRVPTLHIFSVSSADAPEGVVYLDVTPVVMQGSSIRVTVSDGDGGSGPSEGFIAQGLMIEHELIDKTKRLATGRKA